MRKILLVTTLAVAAAVTIGVAVKAQPFGPGMMGQGNSGGYGPGMMQGYGGGYGPGMMQGYGGGYGPGMMGQGYGPGMMQGYGGGYGPGMMQGYGGGYGPGMMGQGYGPGMMQGYGPGMMGNRGYYNSQGDLNLSADDVRKFLARMIRNPNLKVGAVKEKDSDTITAEVVTKDKDALVQRFQFNRHNGFYQPEDGQ